MKTRKWLAVCFGVSLFLLVLSPLALAGEQSRTTQVTSDTWRLSRAGGFGAAESNGAVASIVQFSGKLYASATNLGGAQLWEKNGSSWARVLNTPNWSADPAIPRMKVFKNKLYIGTTNLTVGCGLWRYDGSTWTNTLTDLTGGGGRGFGDKYNLSVTAMEEYNNDLYVATTNYVLDKISQYQLYTEGVHVYKLSGTTDTWSTVSTSNLDNRFNAGITSFAAYNGYLYACTARFDYKNPQLSLETISIDIVSKGCQLLRSSGGKFSVVANNGFTDTRNIASMCMKVYGGKLYIGTANADVHLVFNYTTNRLDDLTYKSNGLFVYSYTGSGTPSEVVKNGFGSSDDFAAACMENITSGGKKRLLVGALNASGPGKLETFDGSSWSAAAIDGFGNANNSGMMSLARVTEASQDVAYVGTSNSKQGCEVWSGTPSTAVNWYLAEGSSDWGFDTYVTMENPNSEVVTAKVTYNTKNGTKTRPNIKLPAMSQTVINPRNDIGEADFSTRVRCLEEKPIAVDRRMLWTGPGAASQEGHASVGVTAPSPVWYLAEGSSNWGFETWLLIQNPGTKAASCQVTYMIEGIGPQTVTKTVAAGSRASFDMSKDIGAHDASIKVVGSQPVICERAMYRNNRREGHDSIGTTGPARNYYLAEGTTDWGFTTYVLVQNPNSSDNTVNITYMTPTGPVKQDPLVVPANSRKTIKVNDYVPGKDLSTRVQGSLPLIAERAMYWDKGLGEACHDSIGMSSPHKIFYLPDGQTQNGYETWTLVQNPNPTSVSIAVTYLTPTGKGNATVTTVIAGNSRQTFNMADKIPSGRAAVMVKCKTTGKGIMVERAIYWNNRGAGTDTIGGYSD